MILEVRYLKGTTMAQPIHVLIADDSAHAREGLRALLVTWPEITVVGEAADGQEAVRLVAESQPDVVLMDVQMPVLDGVQATRLIKQQWPTVTVIVLTMYAMEQSAALAAGADAFLIKGSVPERLLAALGLGLTGGKS
jgi:DNA-binding NarL/FixJ family response regulator